MLENINFPVFLRIISQAPNQGASPLFITQLTSTRQKAKGMW